MTNDEHNLQNQPGDGIGFQISAQPVVPLQRAPEAATEEKTRRWSGLTNSYGGNLFYVIARDPATLFIYWDLDWRRIFAEAQLTACAIYLRVLREDSSLELIAEVDPFAGQYFANVALPGASYICELGCYDGTEWKTLLRSKAVATMDAAEPDDLEAEFATLPLHLSFQRLIDLFHTTDPGNATLAKSVGQTQASERALRATGREVKPGDLGFGEIEETEFVALFGKNEEAQSTDRLSPEMVARWQQFTKRFGASSWGGSSSSR